MTGDSPAPDALDQGALLMVIAPLSIRVRREMLVEVATVDTKALAPAIGLAADLPAVLGGDRGFEGDVIAVLLDAIEGDEHPVDQADVVAVAQADQLLARSDRIRTAETGCLLHGEVQLHAGRIAAADHLTGLEQSRCIDVGPAHLPDELIVLAVRNVLSLPSPGREPDDGAVASLAVHL